MENITRGRLASRASATAGSKSLPRLWVLGASLGGFDALKRFLKDIPAELPAAFIVVSYINKNYVGLFADQLRRVTPLHVGVASTGAALRYRQVVVMPLDHHFLLNTHGRMEIRPAAGRHLYPIDAVMINAARRFGRNAGAMMFSGIGDDGMQGCASILNGGGEVWVQDSASCLMSALPERIGRYCNPGLIASPEEMARQLTESLLPRRRREDEYQEPVRKNEVSYQVAP